MLEEGSQFGAYELIKRIAFGGMAEIHLAKASGIGGFEKLLALKVIHPKYSEDQEFIDMLIDEAKIAVQLSHVNVAQTFDLGKVQQTYYIAMEFIDGKDLYQLLVRCSELDVAIPFEIIAFVGMETASGLQYAHTRSDNYGRELNLIHRDISPQNILVSYDGEVKIVDFGIAKASQRSKETESGVIKGKFFYMSPEQAWGDPIDCRTDIFSTGICLYEMITGEMLYQEEKALVLLDKVRKAEIPSLKARRPNVPPELVDITLRALSRDREQRFQTSGELQGALTGFLYRNWPQFNRGRVADFMRQVFGDQKFVLPMPVPEEQSTSGLMNAGDFNPSDGHSVIFDLNAVEDLTPASIPVTRPAVAPRPPPPVQRPAMAPPPPQRAPSQATAPVDAQFDDADRTVAGAIPILDGGESEFADDDEEEATILQDVWGDSAPPGMAAADDDRTAVLAMSPEDAAALDAPPPPADEEQTTSLFTRPGTERPERLNRPVQQPPPAHRPTPPPRAPAPPPAPPPPRARSERPSAQPQPGVRREAAPPAFDRPAFATKPPNRAVEGGQRTVQGSIETRPGALARFGRWLFTPTGVSLVVILGLIAYAATQILPTLLAGPEVKTATLTIDSVPRGAAVVFDGKALPDPTPTRVTDVAPGANHILELSLAGHESRKETVSFSADEIPEGGEVKRRVFLKQEQRRLIIKTNPAGAEVYLDGMYLGDTPITKTDVDPNAKRNMVLIQKDGFRDHRVEVRWDEKTEQVVDATLDAKGK